MEIEEELYKNIIRSIPILCVDLVIPNADDRYLLVKRGEEPLKDEWWTPGGRLHLGEMLEQGIERKLSEELAINNEFSWSLIGLYQDLFDKSSKGKHLYHTMSVVINVKISEPLLVSLNETSSDYSWQKELPKRMLERLIY